MRHDGFCQLAGGVAGCSGAGGVIGGDAQDRLRCVGVLHPQVHGRFRQVHEDLAPNLKAQQRLSIGGMCLCMCKKQS